MNYQITKVVGGGGGNDNLKCMSNKSIKKNYGGFIMYISLISSVVFGHVWVSRKHVQ